MSDGTMAERRQRRPGYEENAKVWELPSAAEAYQKRLPYPPAVIDTLVSLLRHPGEPVLELGCGTGAIARPLSREFGRVVAVEPSAEMIAVAKRLDGGEAANLEWVCSSAEMFDYPEKYGLAIAAQCLHWMDWDVVFPAVGRALSADGWFVIISVRFEPVPWADGLFAAIQRYSTIRDYEAYDAATVVADEGYFPPEGKAESEQRGRQTIEDYVESFHARAGFAREWMGEERAGEFDREVRRLVSPFANNGELDIRETTTVRWGRPMARAS